MGHWDFCLICDVCSWMSSFMGSMCVAILSVVFCVICSVLMFVSDASGD